MSLSDPGPDSLIRSLELIQEAEAVLQPDILTDVALVSVDYLRASQVLGAAVLGQANELLATKSELTIQNDRLAQAEALLSEERTTNERLVEILVKVERGLLDLEEKQSAIPMLGADTKLPGLDNISALRTDILSVLTLLDPSTVDFNQEQQGLATQNAASIIDAPDDSDVRPVETPMIAEEDGVPSLSISPSPTDIETIAGKRQALAESSHVEDTVTFEHEHDDVEVSRNEKYGVLIATIRDRQTTHPTTIHSWLMKQDVKELAPDTIIAKFCRLVGYSETNAQLLHKLIYGNEEEYEETLLALPIGTFDELKLICEIAENQLEATNYENDEDAIITDEEGNLLDSLFNPLASERLTLNQFIEKNKSHLGMHPRRKIGRLVIPSLFWKLSKGLAEALLDEKLFPS